MANNLSRNNKVLFTIAAILLIGGIFYLAFRKTPEIPTATGTDSLSQQDAVDGINTVVEDFGSRLKNVSLLSPSAASDLESNYQNLITPELMARWTADPSSAPGRLVSSPWPDRIDIASTGKQGDGSYQVAGKIVELTSEDVLNSTVSAERDIILKVENADGKWLISDVTLAEYDTKNPQN